MSYTIEAGPRSGLVPIPSSKSELQRLLLLAALGEKPVLIRRRGACEDVSAMIACLRVLGAEILETAEAIRVTPLKSQAFAAPLSDTTPLCLPCGESAATLRFLLPLAGILNKPLCFERTGSLISRPLEPLINCLSAHGMQFRTEGPRLYASGQLNGGLFRLPGDVSSQFISALLMGLPLLRESSVLRVNWPMESQPYVQLTEEIMKLTGLVLERSELSKPAPQGADGGPLSLVFDPFYWIEGGQRPHLPEEFRAGGDYSAAAAFFCMGALSPQGIVVEGLDPESFQGDKAIVEILCAMGAESASEKGMIALRGGQLKGGIFNTADIPDLVPVLAVTAACAQGNTLLRGAGRLRYKESDRLQGTVALLEALGVRAETKEDSILIYGASLQGGHVKTQGDHRLAMAAAVAACAASGPVTLDDESCINKSYQGFWEDFHNLQRI